MRKYETMFILNPSLTEEEVQASVSLVKDVLEKHKVIVSAEDAMGVRTLAYPINKFERGCYHVIYFEGPSGVVKDLEKFYKVTENILRFIVIKYEQNLEIKAWETMVKKVLGQPVVEKVLKSRSDRGGYQKKPYAKPDYAKRDNTTSTTRSENPKPEAVKSKSSKPQTTTDAETKAKN